MDHQHPLEKVTAHPVLFLGYVSKDKYLAHARMLRVFSRGTGTSSPGSTHRTCICHVAEAKGTEMSYTLKLDWTTHRTRAVTDVLALGPNPALPNDLRLSLTDDLLLYVDDEHPDDVQTIKLDWHPAKIVAVTAVLEQWLGRADWLCIEAREYHGDYFALVNRQAQVHAALRDIYRYQQATRDAIAEYERRTGTVFNHETGKYESKGGN